MRFAGSAPITDFLGKSIDMGAVAQAGAQTRSAVNRAGVQLEGEVGAAGITAQGEVEAAGILADAQTALANAQGNASIMSGIGDIAGGIIGSFGGGGGSAGLPAAGSITKSYDKMVGTTNPYQKDFGSIKFFQ